MSELVDMSLESGASLNFVFSRVEEDKHRYNFWFGDHYHFTVFKDDARAGYLLDEVSVEVGITESEAEKLREKAIEGVKQ